VTTTSTDAAPALPLEIADGEVIALRGMTSIGDGKFSWRTAEDAGRYEYFNSYVLHTGRRAWVIDSGPTAVARRLLAAPWFSRLALEPPVSLVQSRLEPDVLSGLPLWINEFGRGGVDVSAPGAGGLAPLDLFEDLNTQLIVRRSEIPVRFLHGGNVMELGPGRTLEVITPLLRTLSTRWFYEKRSATLFTSDAFSHYSSGVPDDTMVTSEREADFLVQGESLGAAIRRHHLAKYDWLAQADLRPIIDDIRQIFEQRQVDRICPSRGMVIEGRHLVTRNVAEMADMLQELMRVPVQIPSQEGTNGNAER
jgi:flavorubredoxin